MREGEMIWEDTICWMNNGYLWLLMKKGIVKRFL